MKYVLYTTVNRANGTDYDHVARNYEDRAELVAGIDAAIVAANTQCYEDSDLAPSSIIFTVVPC